MEKNNTRTSSKEKPRHSGAKSGWPASAVDSLQAHWNSGLTTAEIAARLDKSVRAVECKIYKLRAGGCILPARRPGKAEQNDQRARRRCLYCGDDFDSSHRGNRICPGCLEDGPYTSAMV